jgi:hypothetical protein
MNVRAGVRPAAAGGEREHVAGIHWWIIVAAFLLTAVYFHSKVDPGTRFAFKQGDLNYGPSWFQVEQFGPFTPAELFTFAFAYLGLVRRLAHRRYNISTRALYFTVTIAAVVMMGTLVGLSSNTQSPIGDWRSLVVGALFAFGLWSTVLTSQEGVFRFAALFVAVVSWYGLDQLFAYARGGGEIAFYGRTPDSNHATLEYMVAAVGISLAFLRTRRLRLLWCTGILVGTIVVVLGFRRYAWVEIGVVFAMFALFAARRDKRYLVGSLGVVLATALAIAFSWSSLQWSERLASLNPFASKYDNALAATNASHLDDINDGWDQVQAHPITGLGVGITYVGQRTARWKGDAGMVHNGPIELWIKFGVLGVLLYLLAYFVVIRDIWRRRFGSRYSDLMAWGAGSFIIANFLITVSIYAWPFAVWEKSVLVFMLVAAMYPSSWREPEKGLPMSIRKQRIAEQQAAERAPEAVPA